MPEINHRVGIKATPKHIYAALTTDTGLASWWTSDTSGAGEVGAIIEFRFGDHVSAFQVTELQPNQSVRWQYHSAAPEAWVGTEVSFELQATEAQTFVRFRHSGWDESSDFMAHCSTKWAVFLLSLKGAIETGRGKPFPNDTPIDHT